MTAAGSFQGGPIFLLENPPRGRCDHIAELDSFMTLHIPEEELFPPDLPQDCAVDARCCLCNSYEPKKVNGNSYSNMSILMHF